MNISWVLADNVVLDPTQELEPLKHIGSFWGSWRTWRAYQTDNVICHDQNKADELLKRAFQAACNFYIPNSAHVALNQPLGVQVYQGDFVHEVEHQEEIIAMHLAASRSDIVLLLGFNWSQINQQHYMGLVSQAIRDNAEIQWVLVDHPGTVHPAMSNLPNLTQDTMLNVLKLLAS